MNAMTLKNGGLKPIFEAIEDEIIRATRKFPSNKHMLPALNEEVGELNKAMMELDRERYIEFHKLGNETTIEKLITMNQEVFDEAMQVACMAIRIMIEGDANFSYQPIHQIGPIK